MHIIPSFPFEDKFSYAFFYPIFSRQRYPKIKFNKSFIVKQMNGHVAMIQFPLSIMQSENLVASQEVGHQATLLHSGDNNVPHQSHETLDKEKKDVARGDSERSLAKNKDKLTLLSFHGAALYWTKVITSSVLVP